MTTLTLITLFALGAMIASFMGVVAGRLNTGEGFVSGRSRCDACGAELPAMALVPILSYVFSGGRACCCGARISAAAPLAEAALGTLFIVAYLQVGFSSALPFLLIAFALLLGLVLYDLAHQILPPALLWPFVVASLCARALLAQNIGAFEMALAVAVAIAAFLLAIHAFSGGRAMGLADAPLAFGLGVLVGPAALPGFVFSFWVGAVIGIVLLARRPRGSRMGTEVPFAPFLAAGFLLAYATQWNPFILTGVLH